MILQDATGGTWRIFAGEPNVESCRVVRLDYSPAQAAEATGITGQPTSDKSRGIRECVLMPGDCGHYYVVLNVTPEDNPSLFERKSLFKAADVTAEGLTAGQT